MRVSSVGCWWAVASSLLPSPGVLLLYRLCFFCTKDLPVDVAAFVSVSAQGERDENDKFSGLHRRDKGRCATKVLRADDVVQYRRTVVPTGSFVDDTVGENAIVLVAILCMVVAQDWLITWLLRSETRFVLFGEPEESELSALGSTIDPRVARSNYSLLSHCNESNDLQNRFNFFLVREPRK